MANARYLYMTADGSISGPFWLSQMREFWKGGKINMRTEVCMEGTRRWEPVEFYPEIFEEDARLPVFAKLRRAKSNPVSLTLWMIVLGLVVAIYLIRQWGGG